MTQTGQIPLRADPNFVAYLRSSSSGKRGRDVLDPLMRGMAFACVMGVTAILIHSWVDFNLQIPANAVLFMVLLALGWISLYHDRHEGTDTIRAHTRTEDS